MKYDLSVVILCYKAEDYVRNFVNQLKSELGAADINYEMVLVANYDNSKDKTPEIVHEIASKESNITVVSEKKKGRMGWDMRSGLRAAKGNYIAIMDGDGQMPVSDIVEVYTLIKSTSFDIVKTYRAYRYDGWHRGFMSYCYNVLFRLLFNPKFPLKDVNSKPKIISRSAYEKLHLVSNDWFTDAEIMIQAIEKNMKISQIATVFYKNERRKTMVAFSTIFEFIYNLFYYRFFK
ncbi:MAG: glycosyltransferase family 2 protein [Chitinophagales bacterium]